MAIEIGCDESGANDTLLVSFQLGVTDQAKKLHKRWRKRLALDGVEYFHAKEYGNFDHGVFAGLDRNKRAALLHDLSKLVRQHMCIGVTANVSKSLYEQKTTQEFRSRWGTAYTFAIQMLVLVAYLYADRFNLRAEFNVLIEDGHRHASQAIESLNKAKQVGLSVPAKLLNIGLGSKADHPILQAADMLAYSHWQQISDPDGTFPLFQALNSRGSIYLPEYINLNNELIDVVTRGVAKWTDSRKQFGARKPNAV
jgi:hypothetical protein